MTGVAAGAVNDLRLTFEAPTTTLELTIIPICADEGPWMLFDDNEWYLEAMPDGSFELQVLSAGGR